MLPAEPRRPRAARRPSAIKHWLGQGALPTDRVAKFLGHAGLAPMPVVPEQPKQSAPKKKAQERARPRPPRPGRGGGAPGVQGTADERRILVGEIGRPHGVRGLVRLRSFTADPAAIGRYGPLTDESGRAASSRGAGAAKRPGIARIDGVADRDAGRAR